MRMAGATHKIAGSTDGVRRPGWHSESMSCIRHGFIRGFAPDGPARGRVGARHWPAAGMPAGSPGGPWRRLARSLPEEGLTAVGGVSRSVVFGCSCLEGTLVVCCFGSGASRASRRTMRCDAKPAHQISASSRLPSQRHAAESRLIQDPRFASLGRRSSIGARASLVSHFPLRRSLRFFGAAVRHSQSRAAQSSSPSITGSGTVRRRCGFVSSDFPEGTSTVRRCSYL
ncbi:hypothetical protein HDV57DRAFT_71057 [Trichoderma longibrachiatum]